MQVNYLGDIKGDTFQLVRTETAPRNTRRDGYGEKIPCPYMIRFGTRLYRVYAICWSNCASHYIQIKGLRYFLRDADFDTAI